jgi:uracil-DNA glycosylase
MKTSEVFIKSLEIRDNLKKNADSEENPIDDSLLPVLPYRISRGISLIIIGQDPTIQNEVAREDIEYTLNLDKAGALKTYIRQICEGLNISFENIYATNVFKYFYTIPPAQTIHILQAHLDLNLALLKEELSTFSNAKIITLGEPVLKLLAGQDQMVRNFWGYDGNPFSYCSAINNRLGRNFYPFPHQPSIRKVFYREHLSDYIVFVQNNL